MYLALTAGFVLWLGYGLLIGSWPVIAFNVANLALSAAILRLKRRGGKRANLDRAAGATGAPGVVGRGRQKIPPRWGPRRQPNAIAGQVMGTICRRRTTSRASPTSGREFGLTGLGQPGTGREEPSWARVFARPPDPFSRDLRRIEGSLHG